MNVERLREVLRYCPESGEFTWLVTSSNRATAGRRAGTGSREYRQIRIDGRVYLEHRLAWLYLHGTFPSAEIDHINGDGNDNRASNLREATRTENAQNKRKAQSTSKSGVQGVKFDRRRGAWVARIKVGGSEKYLGQHHSAEAAHAAYVSAKRELHSHCTL